MCCGPGLVPACAVSVDLEPCTGHCAVPSRGFWPSLIKSPPAVTLTSRVARWWLRALVTVAAEGRTGGWASPVPSIQTVSSGFAGGQRICVCVRHRAAERSLGPAGPAGGISLAGERGKEGQPGGSRTVLEWQREHWIVRRHQSRCLGKETKKQKTRRRQGGRRPGEPCRCDKLKISAAAHGDAPRGLCRRRAFVSLPAAAAGTACGTSLTRPPASLEPRSRCPRRFSRPAVAPPSPSVPSPAPFQLHPLISSSRLAASSLPEILQLLSALAQIWLPHGSETKASGNRQPSCRRPRSHPRAGSSAMGDTGRVQVSG